MKKLRLVMLSFVATAALGAVAAAAVVYYLRRLPDPATADKAGLVKWVVLADLSQEPADIRRLLARRFEQEFRGAGDWSSAKDRLTPEQLDRLWRNVFQLLEAWFDNKVEEYAGLPETERARYVDSTIETLTAWKGLGSLRGSAASEDGGKSPKLVPMLLERVAQWKSQLQPDRRPHADRFVRDLETRWVQQSILGFLTPVKSAPTATN